MLETNIMRIYLDEKRKIEGLIEPTDEGVFYIELIWAIANMKKRWGFLSKDNKDIVWFYLKNELGGDHIPVYKKYFIKNYMKTILLTVHEPIPLF